MSQFTVRLSNGYGKRPLPADDETDGWQPASIELLQQLRDQHDVYNISRKRMRTVAKASRLLNPTFSANCLLNPTKRRSKSWLSLLKFEDWPQEILERIFDYAEDMVLLRASKQLQQRLKNHPFYLTCASLFGDETHMQEFAAGETITAREPHPALRGISLPDYPTRLEMAAHVLEAPWFSRNFFLRIQTYFLDETAKLVWPGTKCPGCSPHTADVKKLSLLLKKEAGNGMSETISMTLRHLSSDVTVQMNPALIKIERIVGDKKELLLSTFPSRYVRELHGPRRRLPNSWFQSTSHCEIPISQRIFLPALGPFSEELDENETTMLSPIAAKQYKLEAAIGDGRIGWFREAMRRLEKDTDKAQVNIERLFDRAAVFGLQSAADIPELVPFQGIYAEDFFKILFQNHATVLRGKKDEDGWVSVYPVVITYTWATQQKWPSAFVKQIIHNLRKWNKGVKEIQEHNNATPSVKSESDTGGTREQTESLRCLGSRGPSIHSWTESSPLQRKSMQGPSIHSWADSSPLQRKSMQGPSIHSWTDSSPLQRKSIQRQPQAVTPKPMWPNLRERLKQIGQWSGEGMYYSY
ncbi:MAG: hypothetical protein Q9227_005766 [Pyrenula ochraceoflavens]